MLKSRIFITIGLLLAGLCLFLACKAYEKKVNVEKEQASRVAISFLNSLSSGDLATAYKYVWSGEELNIRSAEIPQIYKDSKVLEVLKARYDSAKNRPDYYQQFYKMISLTIKIKTVHADLAGKPAVRRPREVTAAEGVPAWRSPPVPTSAFRPVAPAVRSGRLLAPKQRTDEARPVPEVGHQMSSATKVPRS